MKSIRFRLLLALLAVTLGTALAKAQTAEQAPSPMHGHEWGMHGHRMAFFAKQLNLTDDQKTQMKAVLHKEHPALKPLREQQHQLELQLRQYVEGTFDQAKVLALATQKAQVDAQLTVQETRIHNELYQLLTADQQAKLKQIEAQHEARLQQHMQKEPPAAPEQ